MKIAQTCNRNRYSYSSCRPPRLRPYCSRFCQEENLQHACTHAVVTYRLIQIVQHSMSSNVFSQCRSTCQYFPVRNLNITRSKQKPLLFLPPACLQGRPQIFNNTLLLFEEFFALHLFFKNMNNGTKYDTE